MAQITQILYLLIFDICVICGYIFLLKKTLQFTIIS